jgi:hypothetical protein
VHAVGDIDEHVCQREVVDAPSHPAAASTLDVDCR